MTQMAQISEPSSESSPLAVVPTPSPEAVLREQLATVEAERDSLKAKNGKLTAELKQYDEALTDLRTKLKAHEENPFSFALANLDAGAVLHEAGQGIKSLCATVLRRQAKGTIGLSIGIKPFKGQGLIFTSDLKVTEPKPDPAKSVFYASEEGDLSRNDPSQKEFHFPNRERRDDERFDPSLR